MIPFQVYEQVFGGENAKFLASLDDTLRKAEPVQWGIQQLAVLVQFVPFLLPWHIVIDGGYPVTLEKGENGCTVNHQDGIETGKSNMVAVHPKGDALLVRTAKAGGFLHG